MTSRKWLALPLAFLVWFCQNPETESDKVLLTLETDSSFQQFSRLWVGFNFEGEKDTLALFDDSLKHFEDLHKLSIPNRNSGKGSLVFRGFESGDGRLIYSEIRVIDMADGSLVSALTQLDLRTALVPPSPGAPTIRFAVTDTSVSIGDTVTLAAILADSAGELRSYSWNFTGDQTFPPPFALDKPEDTVFGTHIFRDTGIHAVSLKVRNEQRRETVKSMTVRVLLGSSAFLGKLSLGEVELSPDFDKEGEAFSAIVRNDVEDLRIELKPAQAGARIRVADLDLASGDSTVTIDLKVGVNTIPIRVTAQDNKTQRDYELSVTRLPNDNALLESLESDPGRLVPDFSPSKFQYTLALENHQDEFTLTPSALDGPNTQIRVKNQITPTGSPSQAIAVNVGVDTIPVEVRAQNDTTKLVYRVIVTRKGSGDATLKKLVSSQGSLTSDFDPSVADYADTIASGVSSVTLTPTANSATAKISLQGEIIESGETSDSISLDVGHNIIELVVKAQNGDSLVYRVDFYRPASEALLKDIRVSAGTMKPAFQPGRQQYADTVASTVGSITVTAEAEPPVRSLRIQDSAIADLSGSRKVNLAVGDNVLSIVGVAEDGSRQEYQLTVRRQSGDANLTAFGLAPELPRMALQPSVSNYSDTVEFGVDALRILPLTSHAKATIRLNGIPLASGDNPARIGLQKGANVILVKVTAEDTAISKTYNLNIWRRRGYVKAIGGINDESGAGIVQTADGGFVIAGSAEKSATQGLDALLLKTNAGGDTLWSKTFGGTGTDGANAVLQTSDGGFFVAGKTVPPGRSDLDVYWFKTDSLGNKLWERNSGGSADDGATGIGAQSTRDGGFVICSQTASFGSGAMDIYVLRITGSGDTVWTKTFGGTGDDVAFSIQQTRDDGFILAGRTQIAGGATNLFLLKLKPTGDTAWSRSIGGSGGAIGVSVALTADKGFIITGQDESVGGGDALLMKTDSLGNSQWSKSYGGSGADWGRSVLPTADGGYIVAGYTSSDYFGTNSGSSDAFLLRVNSLGNPLWTGIYGGGDPDFASMVKQTADNGFIAVGAVNSSPPSSGKSDIYIIRTDESGNSD